MRITHISDTHNKHKQLNGKLLGGDILIHSGDISSLGRKHEIGEFLKWFSKQEYRYKVFIVGNHDTSFDSEVLLRNKLKHFEGSREWDTECVDGKPQWLVDMLNYLDTNVFYLENSSVEIEGIKIWGSPYSPTFGYGWGFNKDRGYDINEVWNTIPMDTDIVITHSPIYGYNDRAQNTNQNVGCEDLYHRLQEVKPHLHFAGHIHEGYGYRETMWGGYSFNGSSCNLRYEAVNPPITFDYDFTTKELQFKM